jgi:TAG lipase / steryl ester hydrolase / phospholipase A2 / LPA acyltransferase
VEGNNEWKMIDECEHYDAKFVTERLRRLEEARVSCDIERMLHLIRTESSRHLGDMSNLLLYKHSHVGTKYLVDRYISTALATIESLLDVSAKSKCSREETSYILEQLASARQAFGRSALLLSGGATFGMNHIGVLKSLWEAGVLPRIISGASAGSIVCAALCTKTEDEIPGALKNFGNGDFAVFDEKGKSLGLWGRIEKLMQYGSMFDIAHLRRVMQNMLGNITFQEAYNRTRRILNICVSSADLYELPQLLNYVTAPNVLIWSAV